MPTYVKRREPRRTRIDSGGAEDVRVRSATALPSVMVQGYLGMADFPDGSEIAAGWNARLEKAVGTL